MKKHRLLSLRTFFRLFLKMILQVLLKTFSMSYLIILVQLFLASLMATLSINITILVKIQNNNMNIYQKFTDSGEHIIATSDSFIGVQISTNRVRNNKFYTIKTGKARMPGLQQSRINYDNSDRRKAIVYNEIWQQTYCSALYISANKHSSRNSPTWLYL